MGIALRLILLLTFFAIVGCAAGPEGPYNGDNPAGFFPGLWHGFIAWITLILSFFTSIKMYSINNTGAMYDLGFLIGIACWLGGGTGSWCRKRKSRREQEWDQVAEKVEAKVKREMRKWAEAQESDDWPEVEKKLEDKVRNKLKEWADS
ncbi:MAG: hypothetical protein HY788_08055 [Deltaproteobacteria bacterium]|nr:hypothetical protein [Deltaproteobacteria bacterium]